ncbi:MAG: flagellar assembly protein FliW [Lachnospiraceae bacterium]|nr:flagellar assembly protein FliW [Lachnospiraceae bacterium]
MKAKTRLFGEIDIDDGKIIKLVNGIIGFPEFKNFALIFDEEKKEGATIMWLQCMDEPEFALPVIEPLKIMPDYNPTVEDDLLTPLGELNEENTFVLITITVPKDIKEMSVNLRAPFIINTDNNIGSQLIIEDNLPVRYKIYDLLKKEGE